MPTQITRSSRFYRGLSAVVPASIRFVRPAVNYAGQSLAARTSRIRNQAISVNNFLPGGGGDSPQCFSASPSRLPCRVPSAIRQPGRSAVPSASACGPEPPAPFSQSALAVRRCVCGAGSVKPGPVRHTSCHYTSPHAYSRRAPDESAAGEVGAAPLAPAPAPALALAPGRRQA